MRHFWTTRDCLAPKSDYDDVHDEEKYVHSMDWKVLEPTANPLPKSTSALDFCHLEVIRKIRLDSKSVIKCVYVRTLNTSRGLRFLWPDPPIRFELVFAREKSHQNQSPLVPRSALSPCMHPCVSNNSSSASEPSQCQPDTGEFTNAPIR